MNRKRQRQHSYKKYFFWHYVIRFLFIGILTAGMLIPSYYIMIHSMKQKEIDSLNSNMEERFQKLNGTLSMLAGQARLASNQISVIQIGMAKELRDEDGKDQYELSKARKWFQSSINQDDLLVNAYMLTKNNLAFVSGNLVTTNEEEIYGSFYEVEGYTREEWRESILRSHTNYAFLPSAMTNGTFSPNMLGTKEPIIHMIVPISDYGIKSNQVMVYMLSTKRLFHDISPMSHGNLLHLKDKEGNVLAVRERDGTILNGLPEEGQNPSEEQDNWVLIQSGNEITGLEADCYVPQTYFDEILRPAQRMTVLMAVGILFLVAVLSFFMAARHSTSESRTMRMIEKIYPEIMDSGKLDKKKKRAFDDYVLGTIRMLDEKQRNYNERFQIMKNLLEETLMEKIIHGDAQSERDIENCREVLDIKNDYFIAIYLRIIVRGGGKPRYDKSDSARTRQVSEEEERMIIRMVLDLIHHYLTSYVAFPCLRREEEEQDGVFILCLPEASAGERDKMQKCLKKAVAYAESHVDVQICIGIGNLVQGIPRVVQSVREAKRDADQENRNLLLGQEEERKNKKQILFSSKSMRRLSVLLSNGEEKETEVFFHELERMIGETELSDDEEKQIFYGIRSVLDGILKKEGKSDTELPGFEEKRNILEQLGKQQAAAIEICARMREKQEKVTTQRKHDVIAFIHQNFSDSNLCAAMVADRFGVTEKYVFQIVRDCTGKSLGDLIKEIRFSEAEKLLQESVDINKIPERIGFNSLNTFYKAFKRNYGISPGQWRELSREGQIKGSAGGLTP